MVAEAAPETRRADAGREFVDGAIEVRREAFDAIRRVCSATDEAVLVVVGSQGSGKSTLLQRTAADPGLGAHLVQVSAAEARWETSGLSHLLTVWPPETADVLLRRLRGCSADEAYDVASEMVLSLREAGERRVLLVDDLDRMDSTSLAMVALVLRRLRCTGLRVVATVSAMSPESPLTGLPTLTLPMLTVRQSLELARAESRGRHSERQLAEAAHFGGGSASGVVEALRGSGFTVREPESMAGRPPRLGTASERAVDHRLSVLSPEAADVLGWMSLARCTPRTLSPLPPEAVEELLDTGDVRDVAGMLFFVDPRQRAVIYWRMPPPERARRHAALAEASRTTHPPTSLWHASFLPDPPPAAGLVEAARAWVQPETAAAAADLVERVVVGPGGVAAAGVLDVAEALCDVGAYDEARRVSRIGVVGQGDAVTQLRAMIVSLRAGSVVGPEVLDASATAAAGVTPIDVDLMARLLHVVCFYLHELGEVARARQWWGRVDDLVGGHPGGSVRHRVLGECIGAKPPAPPRPLHAPGPTPGPQEQANLLIAARGQSNREQYAQARRVLSALTGLGSSPPLVGELIPLFALENECRAGDVDRAREAAKRVVAMEPSREVVDACRAGGLAVYWALVGRADLAAEPVDQLLSLPSHVASAALQAKVQAALGRCRLDAGELEEAHRLLSRADRDGQRIDDPLVLRHEGDLVESLVRLGDRESAQEALTRLHVRMRRHPSRWGTLVLRRSKALVLEGGAGVAALRGVLAAWPGEVDGPYPYERARTQAMLAQRIEQTGDHATARDHWARAVRAMERVGHQERARSLRAGHLVEETAISRSTPTLLGRLSERERDVVTLVLAGARNREIAAELFVSLRTVEARLTSSYRKLGVRSRAELMAMHLGSRVEPF